MPPPHRIPLPRIHRRHHSTNPYNAFISSTPSAAYTPPATPIPPPNTPLTHRPIAIKDNISTTTHPTTCASALLPSYTPPFDATCVSHLRRAGAVITGKTNMDEFGMGSDSLYSAFGPVSNPASPLLSAGGSSGGSAAAVASGAAWAALGTDTGGSVRLPAAYTGLVGFKPSYGVVSRWGVVAYANSLDTVGVLGSRVRDVRAVFDAISAHDPLDPTSLSPATRARLADLLAARAGGRFPRAPLRIGVPAEYNVAELTPGTRTAWRNTLQALHQRGHTFVPVSLPSTRAALAAYYVLAPAEASSNLAKYDGVRYGFRASPSKGSSKGEGSSEKEATEEDTLYAPIRAHFGPEVARRILLGTFSLSAGARENYFVQAQRVRRVVVREMDGVFRLPRVLVEGAAGADEGVDVLLTPTAPGPPPKRDEVPRGVGAYVRDVFTVPASLAGVPAGSVPVKVGEEGGIGLQVIGQFGDDGLVLDVAGYLEEEGLLARMGAA
ncbi:amidase signature enzyme [Trichodelitschia bisporula]|uniref:Glutamyl-tRNA(Gln) amidotransferase subunit A, mitochondrial n=1 Tax=Trichodelitschia bisporula TaxID=703511 RepID=A0A6G1HR98_9PEZI|nr:amidase signature enzyme [Trichodelitschia bisporula]